MRYKNQFLFLLAVILLSSYDLFAQQDFLKKSEVQTTYRGIGIGSIIAIVASWSRNRSILWAIFHSFCSWFYIIYYLLSGGRKVKNY